MPQEPTHDAPPAAPVLELEGVDVPASATPEACVVRGVDWRVEPGQRWVLAGPSGSGKSSVLQVAAGLLRPARGRQRLFGIDLAELGERDLLSHRIKVGMVFGGAGRLFQHLTVAENVALPLFYHDRDRDSSRLDQVAELLEAFGLAAWAGRYPREVPRRWLQRVALARALALEPEALLVDEPASGLGPHELEWWQVFVNDCPRRNLACCRFVRTLVVTAPDPAAWAGMMDRVARVDAGRWECPPPRSAAGLHPAPGP